MENKGYEKKEEAEKPEIDKEVDKNIDALNEQSAKLEAANARYEAAKNQALKNKTENLLGGKAEAGTPPKEEDNTEYAKKIMRGEI